LLGEKISPKFPGFIDRKLAKTRVSIGGIRVSETQKSILGGMTVLGLSGLVCKVVGFLYKIPLAQIIGASGLAKYQAVFAAYNMLLTISSAGIPVAISRMVSFSITQKDPRSAKRVFRIALSALIGLGCVATLLMIAFSPQLAAGTSVSDTRLGFVVIAPTLLLVCIMSALRGFMQGQQNMIPTAVSQLIEQVGKVAIILPMASWGMQASPEFVSSLGMQSPTAFAAVMVLLGNTVAEAIALIYMVIATQRKRKRFAALEQNELRPIEKKRTLARRLFALSIPITLASCIIPLSGFIDSRMLVRRLMDAGIENLVAEDLFGRYSGFVISLINVPTALSIAIAMSIVPAISSAIARGEEAGIKRQAAMGIRYAFLIGLPCSIGLSMLSRQFLSMLFPFPDQESLITTAELLSLSSLTIVLFTVTQTTEGILNGLRKQLIPMCSLLVGVAVKIFLNYALIGTRSINIYGAPLASIACYTISMLTNLIFAHRHTQMKMDWLNTLLKPVAATAGMAAVLFLAIRIFPGGRLWTCLLIVIGIGAYAGFALLTGAMSREDLKPFMARFGRHRRARGEIN